MSATNHSTRTNRDGRLLAECLVALALVALALVATQALSRAALLLVDDTRIVTQGTAAATSVAEQATLFACSNDATNGSLTKPRLLLTWADNASANSRNRTIELRAQVSPLSTRDSARLQIRAGGFCPW